MLAAWSLRTWGRAYDLVLWFGCTRGTWRRIDRAVSITALFRRVPRCSVLGLPELHSHCAAAGVSCRTSALAVQALSRWASTQPGSGCWGRLIAAIWSAAALLIHNGMKNPPARLSPQADVDGVRWLGDTASFSKRTTRIFHFTPTDQIPAQRAH
jgi:hypothetical protein